MITSTLRTFILTLLTCGLLVACNNPETIIDMSDTSYSLLNTDSTAVSFPDDYKDNITVISFIYTHCPDVCPVITANMKNIQSQLEDTTEIQFVEISFDPERDTPSVLANYKSNFKLNEQFSLLTGTQANVDSLLGKMNILAEKSRIDSVQQDSNQYFMKHSNTIYVMDKQGRIKFEYMGSAVPPEYVAEDINKLR